MVGNGVRRKIKSRSVRHVLNISRIAMVLPTVLTIVIIVLLREKKSIQQVHKEVCKHINSGIKSTITTP